MIGRNLIESRFQQHTFFDAGRNWGSAVIAEANAGASEILIVELMVALGAGDARNLDRVGKIVEKLPLAATWFGLFWFLAVGRAGDGSIRISMSSEKRWISPNPFERDVPPFN